MPNSVKHCICYYLHFTLILHLLIHYTVSLSQSLWFLVSSTTNRPAHYRCHWPQDYWLLSMFSSHVTCTHHLLPRDKPVTSLDSGHILWLASKQMLYPGIGGVSQLDFAVTRFWRNWFADNGMGWLSLTVECITSLTHKYYLHSYSSI